MEFDACQTKINRLELRKEQLQSSLKRLERAVEFSKQTMDDIKEAIDIVQNLAASIQERIHEKIAKTVTECLNAVFDDAYEFRINFERKRNKTEAKLVFVRDGVEFSDPLNEVGGGVLDVASLALRLSVICLTLPSPRKIVFLDEPFKNVRGEIHKKRTREMLISLSEELGFSFMINTDIPAYQLGTIIEMG